MRSHEIKEGNTVKLLSDIVDGLDAMTGHIKDCQHEIVSLNERIKELDSEIYQLKQTSDALESMTFPK